MECLAHLPAFKTVKMTGGGSWRDLLARARSARRRARRAAHRILNDWKLRALWNRARGGDETIPNDIRLNDFVNVMHN